MDKNHAIAGQLPDEDVIAIARADGVLHDNVTDSHKVAGKDKLAVLSDDGESLHESRLINSLEWGSTDCTLIAWATA